MRTLSKPLQRKVTARRIAYGYNPDLVVTLHPDATIDVREARSRRPPMSFDIPTLYVAGRIAEALGTFRKVGRRRCRGR